MLKSTTPWVGTGAVTRAAFTAHEPTMHEWYPVTNTTTRAQYVTDLGNDGITISSANPARVHRADAGLGMNHEYSHDGTTWITVGGKRGATVISGSSDVAVAHGCGYTPTTVNVQVTFVGSGSATVAQLAACIVWSIDGTNFTVRTIRRDTNAIFTGNSIGIVWHAI